MVVVVVVVVDCVANGLWLIDEVLDKRTKNGSVEYLIRWVSRGEDDEDLETWQRHADLPSGPYSRAREKISVYNTKKRGASK